MGKGEESPEKGEKGRRRIGKEREHKKLNKHIASKLHSQTQAYKFLGEIFMFKAICSYFQKTQKEIIVMEGDVKRLKSESNERAWRTRRTQTADSRGMRRTDKQR